MILINCIRDTFKYCSDSIALVDNEKSYTYSELNICIEKWVGFLLSKKISKGSHVAICIERSINQIAVILATLRIGAKYVPIDSEYPIDRIQFMVTSSESDLILVSSKFKEKFEKFNVHYVEDIKKFTRSDFEEIDFSKAGYLIFTSGSTGKPKAVEMSLRSLSNLISWQKEQMSLFKNIVLQYTPISFDVHFQEIFFSLSTGGTLVLTSDLERLDIKALINKLNNFKVTHLFLPFVALKQLSTLANKLNIYPKNLIHVTTAGEQLRICKDIKNFFKETKSKLHNHYGPSETHVVTANTLEENVDFWNELPAIGKPISNTSIFLLDEQGHPSDEEGEAYIGGICLAEGYFNDIERTNERFLDHELFGRVYKTGDILKNIGGSYYFQRRNDDQVKIRGYRIELKEIESHIEKIEDVELAACKIEQINGENVICAYVVGMVNEKNVIAELKKKLPNYMVPSFIFLKEKIATTPSGKVDYKKLIPEIKTQKNSSSSLDRDLKKRIRNIWKNIIGLEFDDNENLFEIGATSLSAMQALVEINNEEDIVSIADIFEYPSINQLIKYLEKEQSETKKNLLRSENNDIAIIATASRFIGCSNEDDLFNILKEGKSNTHLIPIEDIDCSVSSEKKIKENFVPVKQTEEFMFEFDNTLFKTNPKEALLMDPQQRKFLELCYEVIENAGYDLTKVNQDIGIFAGAGVSKYKEILLKENNLINEENEFNTMLGLEKDFIALRAAYKLNLKGPALTINTACSTSLVAIIEAVNNLRNNKCSMAIAGGVAISGQVNPGHMYQEGGILSKDGICKPFSDDATGTVFTDGAGVILLKRLEDAIKDNDQILAVIKGVGYNNDGSEKSSFTAPSVIGQAKAIEMAISDAGVDVDSINYIETHGTATPVGDPIEFEGIKKALKTKKTICYLGSVKGNIGHTTAAAGVASVIKMIQAFKHNMLFKMPNLTKENKYLNLNKTIFKIPRDNIEVASTIIAGVSSFGVGGTNAHIIMESYNKNEIEQNLESNLPIAFKISAPTEIQLRRVENKLKKLILNKPNNEKQKIAYTLETGRIKHPFKKIIIKDRLKKYELVVSNKNDQNVILIFSGQGSFYSEQGKKLYAIDSEFKKNIDDCIEISNKWNCSIDNEKIFNQEIFNNPKYVQLVLFIYQYSLFKASEINLSTVSKIIGHSLGEYCTAVISNVFTLEDAIRIIIKRSELISRLESGKMISINRNETKTRELISKYNLDVAAINSSTTTVVSGASLEIIKLTEQLNAEKIGFIELNTTHGYHSRMLEPILDEFKNFLNDIKFNEPTLNFEQTCRTSNLKINSCEYWVKQLRHEVNFLDAFVESLDNNKRNVIVDFGPKSSLGTIMNLYARKNSIDLVHVTCSGNDVSDEVFNFQKSLAQLWAFDISSKNLIIEEYNKKKALAPGYSFLKKKFLIRGGIMKKSLVKDLKQTFEDASGIDITNDDFGVNFLEFGLDSLFFTQFSLDINKQYQVDISFRDLMDKYNSINLLNEYLLSFDKVKDRYNASEEPIVVPVNIKDNIEKKIESSFKSEINNETKKEIIQVQSAPIMVSQQHMKQSRNGSAIEKIIQQQLELMNNQLMLLSSGNLTVSAKEIDSNIEISKDVKEIKKDEDETSVNLNSSKKINNLKDAFGAQARISSERSNELKALEGPLVKEFFEKYNKKTFQSKLFTQKNRKNHSDPRVVTGFKPEVKEIVYPIVVKKSYMQKLWDLDGNEYIDMTCGFGSNFFGNGNEKIKKHVLKQIDEGIELGPQHPLVEEVSLLINELTGNERTAFCNTGSEAVLGAMRIARTVTGRDKIIAFSGSYHGINDEVIVRNLRDKAMPAAPGINKESVSNMIILDYGTPESLEIIRKMSKDVAAILVEPVQSRRSDFHPKDFLIEVRKITEETNTCLIFDEIITGFRVDPAGAQGYFGIRADLCTYGKIVGGGMPIGVVSGKSKYMDALDGGHWQYGDDSTPTVGVTYFAGTFVRHPLALAAAKGALEILKEGGKSQLNKLSSTAQAFVDEVNNFLDIENVPLKIDNFCSLMKPKWKKDVGGGEVLFALLRYNGLHVYDGFPWFINLAHTENELKMAIDIIKKSVREMQRFGLFPMSNSDIEFDLDPKIFDVKGAPMPGAKLGKDEHGNPAWFLEDQNNKGTYYILKKGTNE